MSKKSDDKEKTMEKEPESLEPKKELSQEPPAPKAEPIKIMGEPKPEPKAEPSPDIGKIVSDVFDQKLAKFLEKGPENAPAPTPQPKSYRLFDEFDLGV